MWFSTWHVYQEKSKAWMILDGSSKLKNQIWWDINMNIKQYIYIDDIKNYIEQKNSMI